jgi:hypothetical protein
LAKVKIALANIKQIKQIEIMDIKIEIELKDSTWGFSDLLGGRELNIQTKKEIIELLKEDIREVFDQQIEVKQLNK